MYYKFVIGATTLMTLTIPNANASLPNAPLQIIATIQQYIKFGLNFHFLSLVYIYIHYSRSSSSSSSSESKLYFFRCMLIFPLSASFFCCAPTIPSSISINFPSEIFESSLPCMAMLAIIPSTADALSFFTNFDLFVCNVRRKNGSNQCEHLSCSTSITQIMWTIHDK